MKGFTNDYADQRWGIFLAFALGYVILVELVSARRHRSSSADGGSPDERRSPLRQPRSRDPRAAPHLQHRRRRRARRRHRFRRLAAPGHRAVRVRQVGAVRHAALHRGDPRRRPADTLQMAFSAIIGAVVFGLVFGVGKLSDHAWIRWPCWLVVEFFRAVPVILLMIFCFYASSAAWTTLQPPPVLVRRDRPDPLQRRRARRGLPRRHQRGAEGPGGGGVRHRHAQDAR